MSVLPDTVEAMEPKKEPKQYIIDENGQPKATSKTGLEQLEVDATLKALEMTGGDIEKAKKIPFWDILKKLAGKR